MTPEEARRFDPALKDLSDEELIEAIWLLDQLAELTLSVYFENLITEHPDDCRGAPLIRTIKPKL